MKAEGVRNLQQDRSGVLYLADTVPLVGWLVGWLAGLTHPVLFLSTRFPQPAFQSQPVHGGGWPQAVVSTLMAPWPHPGAFKPLKPELQSQRLELVWGGAWIESLSRGL